MEPLFISCEGSGAVSPGWCPMCAMPVERLSIIPDHQRPDLLAMLARGDFDAH